MKPIERIKLGLRIFRSFLTNEKKTGSSRCLKVKLHRQWTNFSCTAAVAQMVCHYYGIKLTHVKAIKLTKCLPDGASLPFVARMLRQEYGLTIKSLKTKAQVHAALKRGEPVITNDSVSYSNNHAVLLVGETPKGLWIADPAVCEVYWRHENQVMAGADEFIAVSA